MDKKEILALINEAHIGYLATVDGKAARVRGMETYRADDNGIIFYTGKMKNVYQQMAKNPDIEVCYFHKGTQVRVRGKMEILEDMALKKEIVSKRDFLKPFVGEDLAGLAVCRLRGKATTWTMQGNNPLVPAVFIDL
jgi:pyridoxamine 5'-phosphate oxidase